MSTNPAPPEDDSASPVPAAYSPTSPVIDDDDDQTETIASNEQHDLNDDEDDDEDDDGYDNSKYMKLIRDGRVNSPGTMATYESVLAKKQSSGESPILRDDDDDINKRVQKIDRMAQQISEIRKNPEGLMTPRKLPAVPSSDYYGARPTGRTSSNGHIEMSMGPAVPSNKAYDQSSVTFFVPPTSAPQDYQVPKQMTYEMKSRKKFNEIAELSKDDSEVNKGTLTRCHMIELAAKSLNIKSSLPVGSDEQSAASHIIDNHIRFRVTRSDIIEAVDQDFETRDSSDPTTVAGLNKVAKDELKIQSRRLDSREYELQDYIENVQGYESEAKGKMEVELEKEFVDLRLKNLKGLTQQQFRTKFQSELNRREIAIEKETAKDLVKKETELAAMKYKRAKIKRGLTNCRSNEQIMESYEHYKLVMVGEILDIIRMYPHMVSKLSHPTTHIESGRISQNPVTDQSLPHIIQRLFEEYQQMSFTTFIQAFLKQLAALPSAQLVANPLIAYEQSIEFTTQMLTNGSFKYLNSTDMVRTLVMLAKMVNAPTTVINEVCQLINVHEKKLRTNPTYRPAELEMSSAIGEYLKNLSLSKAYSKSAQKEIIDLSRPQSPAIRPLTFKQPIRLDRAYSAQENSKRTATGRFSGIVSMDAKEEYILPSGKKVAYLALRTAKDVCAGCYNDANASTWCKPTRHYCKRCDKCGYYGHSRTWCQQKN